MVRKFAAKLAFMLFAICANHAASAESLNGLRINFQSNEEVNPELAEAIQKIFSGYTKDSIDVFTTARIDDRVAMVNISKAGDGSYLFFVDLIGKKISSDGIDLFHEIGSVTDLSGNNWLIFESTSFSRGAYKNEYNGVLVRKNSAGGYELQYFPLFSDLEYSETSGKTAKQIVEELCLDDRGPPFFTFLSMKINHDVKSRADSIDVNAEKIACAVNKQSHVNLRFVPKEKGFSSSKRRGVDVRTIKVEWETPDNSKLNSIIYHSDPSQN